MAEECGARNGDGDIYCNLGAEHTGFHKQLHPTSGGSIGWPQRTIYVAADDPLGARWVNMNRDSLQEQRIAIHTSRVAVEPGFAFIDDGTGSGTIFKFEPTIEPASAPTEGQGG